MKAVAGVVAQVAGALVLVAVAAESVWRSFRDFGQKPTKVDRQDGRTASPVVAVGVSQVGQGASPAGVSAALPSPATPAASPHRVLAEKWEGIDQPPSPVTDDLIARTVRTTYGEYLR